MVQIAVNEIAVYGGTLEGLERVSWLMSYTSAQECLFRTHFADSPQSIGTSNQFTSDLVSLYEAILKFLEKAYRYYKRNAFSEVIFQSASASTYHT
jgi:hypothetical protein